MKWRQLLVKLVWDPQKLKKKKLQIDILEHSFVCRGMETEKTQDVVLEKG